MAGMCTLEVIAKNTKPKMLGPSKVQTHYLYNRQLKETQEEVKMRGPRESKQLEWYKYAPA